MSGPVIRGYGFTNSRQKSPTGWTSTTRVHPGLPPSGCPPPSPVPPLKLRVLGGLNGGDHTKAEISGIFLRNPKTLKNSNKNFPKKLRNSGEPLKIPGRIFPELENDPISLPEFPAEFFQNWKIHLRSYRFLKKKGDAILDNFVGSGAIGVGLAIGRNVIGYDLSPANIEFCRQRYAAILNEEGESRQNVSIEESLEEADFDLVESQIRDLADENLVAA